jgi:hypothetical protein
VVGSLFGYLQGVKKCMQNKTMQQKILVKLYT